MIRALRKKIQLILVNLFLRLYTGKNGLASTQAEFAQEDKRNIKNIVIYSSTALGDFMMNSPAIHAIRREYPDAHITLICHKKMVQFLSTGKDWDSLIAWDNKLTTVSALVENIKQQGRPDAAIILHSHTPYDFLSALRAGAKYVFIDNDKQAIPLVSKWATSRLKNFVGHTIQRKLELIAPFLSHEPSRAMRLPAEVVVEEATRDPAVKYVGFQMGASSLRKCWSTENFARLATQMINDNDAVKIVLIGAPNEVALQDKFLQQLDARYHDRVLPLIGKTTIPGLLQEIKKMSLLVTSDTGPLHLAVAMQVPTVSMFVVTSPMLYGPYQDPELHSVIYKAFTTLDEQHYASALDKISLNEVYARVKTFL